MKNWEKNIREITPYVPGEQPDFPDMIKLNTNENPYPPAPGVTRMLKELQADRLSLYPNPEAKLLVNELSVQYGIEPERIFVGVGSDDVLGMIFLTCFCSEKPVLFPDITYSFYDVWAKLFRVPYRTMPLDEEFRIHKEDYYTENGGVIIANPNAPTSIGEGLDFIEDILEHNQDSVVVVDEAYVDFGGESALSLLEKYENLLVVQTFSKSRSMAGMRIGFAFGSKRLISAIYAVRNSYNSYTMNYPSIMCGAEALKDRAYFEECTGRVIATRERVKKELKALGFSFPDSKTNFLFATHESVPAAELFNMLREKHIFVRYFKMPRIDNYLRITIGTDAQMNRLIEVLKEYLDGCRR
ncbi:MAG: histidinol-phosphate transaminase [Lachnospiraceae bacterium]|nr:histidinol-phosphate transaminase [Lachnospiraceae bacterium]